MKTNMSSYMMSLAIVFLFGFLFNFSWSSDILKVFWYGGGGGGWASIKRDYCPNGDFSYSYYDRTCWENNVSTSTGVKIDSSVKYDLIKNWLLELTQFKKNSDYVWKKITGEKWSITISNETNNGKLYIFSSTSVVWDKSWDGKITPPEVIRNKQAAKLWVVFIKVGNPKGKLYLSKTTELVINTKFYNGAKLQIFESTDWKKWKLHSKSVSDNWKVSIKTKTLSFFVIKLEQVSLVIR